MYVSLSVYALRISALKIGFESKHTNIFNVFVIPPKRNANTQRILYRNSHTHTQTLIPHASKYYTHTINQFKAANVALVVIFVLKAQARNETKRLFICLACVCEHTTCDTVIIFSIIDSIELMQLNSSVAPAASVTR